MDIKMHNESLTWKNDGVMPGTSFSVILTLEAKGVSSGVFDLRLSPHFTEKGFSSHGQHLD